MLHITSSHLLQKRFRKRNIFHNRIICNQRLIRKQPLPFAREPLTFKLETHQMEVRNTSDGKRRKNRTLFLSVKDTFPVALGEVNQTGMTATSLNSTADRFHRLVTRMRA